MLAAAKLRFEMFKDDIAKEGRSSSVRRFHLKRTFKKKTQLGSFVFQKIMVVLTMLSLLCMFKACILDNWLWERL